MGIIPGAENIDMFSMIGPIVQWLAYGFYMLIFGIMAIGVYVFTQYKIKVTVFPMYGSGKDGVFSIQKPTWNRVKWNKDKSAWKPLLPLGNKLELEPFDSEYLYPGNRVYTFSLNDVWIPGRINVTQTEKTIRTEINPVPSYIRNWQSLTYKKNELEYAIHDFWTDNKMIIVGLIMGIAMLCAALIFIYLSYQMAGAGSADISALTSAIKGFSNIGGAPPG